MVIQETLISFQENIIDYKCTEISEKDVNKNMREQESVQST